MVSRKGRFSVGHPVDVATGVVTLQQLDIHIPCRVALTWTRYYSTTNIEASDSPLGAGWRTEYSAMLRKDTEGYTFISPEGDEIIFDDPEGKVDADGAVVNLGFCMELFRRGEDYIVSNWNTDTQTVTRYVFQPGEGGEYWPLHRVEDVTGQGVTINYDSRKRIESIVESRGKRRLRVRYNNHDLISEISVAVGERYQRRLVRYEYDSQGRLTAAYNSVNEPTKYEYDGNNRLVKETARDGGAFFFAYDRQGRCIKTNGLDNYDAQTLEYHEFENVTIVTDSLGGTRLYQYTDAGQVTRAVSPSGFIKFYEYDEHGRIVTEIDQNGGAIRYKFDDAGNCIQSENQMGQTEDIAYNEYRRPISHKDIAGNTWTREYDDLNRLVSITAPTGASWQFSYNTEGDFASITNPKDAITRFTYNEFGDLVSKINWEGATRYYDWDMEGRLLRRTDGLGYTTEYQYDLRGYPQKVILPDNSTVELTFNSDGNLAERVDQNGQRTAFYFHPCRRLRRIEYPDGSTRTFEWSTIPRQLTGISNELGETYQYYYDADGRLAREVDFDGSEYGFEYDAAGWCTGITEPGGNTTLFERNAIGAITKKIHHDGEITVFEYDDSGYIVGAANSDCRLDFERNAFGRIVRESCNGHWVESEYDELGKKISRATDLGHEDQFLYNEDGCLCDLNPGGWGNVAFTRDFEGQEVERRYTDQLVYRQEYDHDGRPITQWLGLGRRRLDKYRPRTGGEDISNVDWLADELLVNRSLTYEPTGYLSRIDDKLSGNITRYSFDPRGRLRDVKRSVGIDEHYDLDKAGNIISADYAGTRGRSGKPDDPLPVEGKKFRYASGNRLIAKNNTRYEYDGNGRTIRKIEDPDSGSPGVWEYKWNSAGLLGSVKRPDGQTWRYYYDPFGRRIRKEGPEEVTEYVWDDFTIVHEIHNEDDPITWIFEPSSFRPFGKIENGEIYFCVNDQAGAPQEMLSESGEVVWRARNTVWGSSFPDSPGIDGGDGKVKCPIRFQGQWFDDESGLCYNRFRYYDPERGTYISKDPGGITDSLNLYNYPRDPLRYIDPYGLFGVDDTGHYVYGLYHDGDTDPYYVGISNDTNRRRGEHETSGRLGSGDRMRVISGDPASDGLTYAQARGQEQAYMEHYGTRPRDNRGTFPGNVNNSFRHERTDERGEAYQEEYCRRMRDLTGEEPDG